MIGGFSPMFYIFGTDYLTHQVSNKDIVICSDLIEKKGNDSKVKHV